MEWQNEASFFCTLSFHALLTNAGLYAGQAAALVTLVALKLALKSGLGSGFAVALRDSTARMEFTENGIVVSVFGDF